MCKTTVLVTIGVALFIGSCTNSEPGNGVSNADSNSPLLATQEQNYTPAIVDEFRATDFTSFLGKDFVAYHADSLGGVEFSTQSGYVAGGTLESPGRVVGIAVFESAQAAMDAVAGRRHRVPAFKLP